jgi:hypothetical protein
MIRRLAGEIPLRNLTHWPVHPDMFPVHLFLKHVIPFFDPLFHHFCFDHFHLYLRCPYELTTPTVVVRVFRHQLSLYPRLEYPIPSHPIYPIYLILTARSLGHQVSSLAMLAFHTKPWAAIDIYLPLVLS